MSKSAEKIKKSTEVWEEKVIKPKLEKLKLKENQTKFYTPENMEDFDFLEKVGYPGTYPFTAGNDSVPKGMFLA